MFMDIVIESQGTEETVMESKRHRSPNFSKAERNKLLNLVLEEKEIVDNKKTGAAFWREKEESWHRISEKFNHGVDISGIRTTHSLKKYFENQKKAFRQMVAKNKLESMAAGAPVPLKLSRDDKILLEFIEEKPDLVEMCSASSDSDNLILDESSLDVSKPTVIHVISSEHDIDEASEGEWRSDDVQKSNHQEEESINDDQRSTDWCECGRLKTTSVYSSRKRKLDENLVKLKLEVQILKKQKLLAAKKLADRQLQIAEQEQRLHDKEMKLKLEILAEQLKFQKARTSLLINTDINL